jgi:hypothetical protein
MIMKSSRASSNISYLTRPFTQSGWRDLNSRPLDLQIGPWSSVNHLSLISIGLPLMCAEFGRRGP